MLQSIPLAQDLISALIATATDLPQSQRQGTLWDAVADAEASKSVPRDTKGQIPELATVHRQ